MSRNLRIEYSGAFHHVMNRGYNKANLFFDFADFEKFITCLESTFHSHALVIHAYCLMNNHFHLFTETPNANLQNAMHKLQVKYAKYFKKRYSLPGKVFEKRYLAYLVDSDTYALNLVKYIHQNPLNIIVNDLVDWSFSSYKYYFNSLLERPSFLYKDLVLGQLDSNPKKAISKFKQFMSSEEDSCWLPDDFITGKSILGSKDFVNRVQQYLPKEINTECSGLIVLKKEEKISVLKEFVSKTNLPFEVQLNLLLYAFRQKTFLNTKEINQHLGLNLKSSALSTRVARIKDRARMDQVIAKTIIGINKL